MCREMEQQQQQQQQQQQYNLINRKDEEINVAIDHIVGYRWNGK